MGARHGAALCVFNVEFAGEEDKDCISQLPFPNHPVARLAVDDVTRTHQRFNFDGRQPFEKGYLGILMPP